MMALAISKMDCDYDATKRLSLFLAVVLMGLLCLSSAHSATYYVANDGDDFRTAGQAQDPSTPWKSIARINYFVLRPGDNVLFKRGDIWREGLKTSNSGTPGNPISFGAYGSGDKPIISGSSVISGWTPYQGNIYVADSPNEVNQMFFNDAPLTLARYPNQGYLSIDQKTNSTTFVDNAIDTSVDWSGATAHIRSKQWMITSTTVGSFNSAQKSLSLSSEPTYGIPSTPGWGYFLNNKLEALDSPGEWYYDDATQKAYVWMPDGDTPANYQIEGSTLSHGIELTASAHDVNISDLTIKQSASHAIFANRSSNITVSNNSILYPDGVGVFIGDTFVPHGSGSTVEGNTIQGANFIGVYTSNDNATISNNSIEDIGEFDRMNANGIGGALYGALGMKLRGDGNQILNNHIDGTGYLGITFAGQNTLIEQNLIENTGKTKDDGAAIYSFNPDAALPGAAGSIIRNNIILDTQGAPEGTPDENFRSVSAGIYLDERVHDVIVDGNTIAGSYNRGIFLHRAKDNQITNNVLYNNYDAQLKFTEGNGADPVSGNTVEDNVLFSLAADQDSFSLSSQASNPDFGDFDRNYYWNPYSEDVIRYRSASVSSTVFTLAEWQAFISDDANSTTNSTYFDPGAGNPEDLAVLFMNPTTTSEVISLGGSTYFDLDGNSISGNITLLPFSSRVLILDAAPILAGDYNSDGIVNAADYTVWRDNLGAPEGTLPNDTDGGVISQSQYDTWVANYGNVTPPSLAVPEPTTIMLLSLVSLSIATLRKRLSSP